MSIEKIESAILKAVGADGSVRSDALAEQLSVDHQEVVGAAKSLEAEEYIVATLQTKPVWRITPEAEKILANGSPEFLLWELLAGGEQEQGAVQAKMGKEDAAVAMSNGMKSKIFKLNKKDGGVFLERNPAAKDVADVTRDALVRASKGAEVSADEVQTLKKRKLATLESVKVFSYSKGPKFSAERKAKAVGDLTKEMLRNGSWKTTEFKEYNFAATSAEVDGGQLHPVNKIRQEFREILMELGFQEMHTQHWVESSFWNFDSLFIPQQHPARDLQDTFFISKPECSKIVHRDLMAKVKAAHERAFRCEWKESESSRNILRTHTTGSSAFTLYKLAQMSTTDENGKVNFKPGRYYSIDRVFRNEEMDRTHLCEFHQVEGFVIDRDITLSKMMHTFDAFFRRIGIKQLRFKPAFNPYTEPSMEIFGFHTGLNKWIEVGNSGLFRPELLGPLGFDDGVAVMAWGLSLERPTMIKYGLTNIGDLCGHRVDPKFIKRAVIARF